MHGLTGGRGYGRQKLATQVQLAASCYPPLGGNLCCILGPLWSRNNNFSFHGPFHWIGATAPTMWRGCASIQNIGDLFGHFASRHHQRFVDVDAALGDTARRLADEGRDRQLRVPKLGRRAGKELAQGMGCHVLHPCNVFTYRAGPLWQRHEGSPRFASDHSRGQQGSSIAFPGRR